MSRRHADPVDVVRRDDVPEQFLWRERPYVVREVLATWSESGPWWDSARARSVTIGETVSAGAGPADKLVLTPIPASPRWDQRAWGEPAPDVGAVAGPAGLDGDERDYWRVEAGRGRVSAPGVFDLCFDWTRGSGHCPGSSTEGPPR